ncbi:hypothetical protein GCM10007158_14510 [Vreelandella hamiltonii]|uniref:Uncharacterized protein n=1 Tax=Halomonas johnsoniae TaxID=502832 RepID=A0ABQ2WGK0_9GAMM|nr:hypothetical protein GCM10007158_14510 [Halomonas johnsoniae]
MTLAIVATRAGVGLEAPPVHVEVHLANGLPGLTLVGLPETAVKESRERVRSALINAGFDFPIKILLPPNPNIYLSQLYNLWHCRIKYFFFQCKSPSISNHDRKLLKISTQWFL